MSHQFAWQDKPPCWRCKHFVALVVGGSAACSVGGHMHAQATPERGCAAHLVDPKRAGQGQPQAVSFLDAWRLAPGIERPAEVLTLMQQEFRVLVCGGRDYADRDAAFAALDRADRKRRITVVIHGSYRSADTLADEWGKRRMREVLPFPADWDRLGPRAGPVRNQRMLDEGRPHAVIALPGGGGTADMVRRASAAALPVWEPAPAVLARMVTQNAQREAGGAVPGWRDGQEHQWSRDPGRKARRR
jgi:hypothetical protein